MPPAVSTSEPAGLAGVFEPAFLRKLDRLQLHVRHSLAARPGSTPMPYGTQPSGIEFANYKAYDRGDDLRHLDWNAYGRFDQLLIRTFRAEREVALHLLLDCSASMAAPASDGKFEMALGVAASFAYVSLRKNDPVRLVAAGGQSLRVSPWFRHRQTLGQIREYLGALRPAGATTWPENMSGYAGATRTPGVAVVLSDFLTEPARYKAALRGLVGRGWTVVAVRLLGPGERDPSRLFRRGRLCDSETGVERVISLTPANRARYEGTLRNHLDALRTWCQRHEVFVAVMDPHAGLEHLLFHDLAGTGILRRRT
jgi:uncharacterized protein (DUF58 family)